MNASRKFYKTTLTIAVLAADEPFRFSGYEDLAYAVLESTYSGAVEAETVQELTAAEAVAALLDQDSDPEFFQLARSGADLADTDVALCAECGRYAKIVYRTHTDEAICVACYAAMEELDDETDY